MHSLFTLLGEVKLAFKQNKNYCSEMPLLKFSLLVKCWNFGQVTNVWILSVHRSVFQHKTLLLPVSFWLMHILWASVFRHLSSTALQCSLCSEWYQKFAGRRDKCLVVVVMFVVFVLWEKSLASVLGPDTYFYLRYSLIPCAAVLEHL